MQAGKPRIKLKQFRTDGYFNTFTKAGLGSHNKGTFYFLPRTMSEVFDAYRSSGLVKKIIDIYPDEVMRSGYMVSADFGDEVVSALNKSPILLNSKIKEASSLARVTGGAAILLVTDDIQADNPKAFEEALVVENVNEIIGLQVFSRYYLVPVLEELIDDISSPDFNKPKYYDLVKKPHSFFSVSARNENVLTRIHRSRLLIFNGAGTVKDVKERNGYWDDSVLDLVWGRVTDLYESLSSSSSVAKNFVQQVISIDGLSSAMMTVDGPDLIKARLAILEDSLNSIGLFLIDANESYSKTTASTAGLSDIIQDQRMQICADTGIPYSKLFGRSPGGLNATGEHEEKNFIQSIESWRSHEIEPHILKMVELGYKHIGKSSEIDFSIDWNEIDPISEKERAEVEFSRAKTDQVYLDSGVYTPDEVRNARQGSDNYNNPIKVNGSAPSLDLPDMDNVDG